VTALLGAAATVTAAVIANSAGAINISLPSTATPTVRVTETVTAAASTNSTTTASSSAGLLNISCPADHNCKSYDLTAQYVNGSIAGIGVVDGSVATNGGNDVDFRASDDGSPEIVSYGARAYSTFVTTQNASMQQCLTATNSDPDPQPITKFYAGMLFCVVPNIVNSGVALFEETEPLDSSNTLHLHEIYWPAQ